MFSFSRDDVYWRLDDEKYEIAEADPPYPRPTGTWWFGC
jgi:Hemopexin